MSYPFPGQTLSIVHQTKSEVVIQALTPKFGLRELDYVDPMNDMESRSFVFTRTAHKTYEVSYMQSSLKAPPTVEASPACVTSAG